MSNNYRTQKTNKKVGFKINSDILIFTSFVILLFVVVQLSSLTIFGTKGAELTNIRRQQEQYVLENEMLRAQINDLQSLSRIEDIAVNQLGMVEVTNIEYLHSPETISSTL